VTPKKSIPAKPRVMRDRRWLALAMGVSITLGAGALYGSYSQRWGPPADLVAAAARLAELPHQIGAWKMVEELPMEKSALKMLECAAYANRRYINEHTGQSISLAILVGPPGPIAVHTPEICFSSRDYEIQSERQSVSVDESPSKRHTFWRVDFKSRNALADELRIYYAWSPGGLWEAADSPRYEFTAAPLLYKIQLATPVASRLRGDGADPGRQFLEDLSESEWTLSAG
jgi:hypothetical protein